jgi:hypothetical protein
MHFNIEFYRFKNIFFQRSRQINQFTMINFKNLNNIPKNNTSIILDYSLYKKKIIERNKIFLKTFTILWDNYLEKFSGYLYQSLKIKFFYNLISKKNLNLFISWKYVDIDCSFFDLFSLFQKNFTLSIPIVSLKENIFIKIITLKIAIFKIIKNLSKFAFILKNLFAKFEYYILEKSEMNQDIKKIKKINIIYNLIAKLN